MLEFASLAATTRQQALTLLREPDAVLRNGKDDYAVLGPSTGNRRHRVWLEDGLWRCDSDHSASRRPNQDAPCIHMVVAFVRAQLIEMPNAAPGVHRKGRDRAAERRAWRRMATRFPEILADLLRVGVPAMAEPTPKSSDDAGGRPPRALEAVVYQAVYRVWHRMGMEASQGIPNPWGACSASTIGKFHAHAASVRLLKRLVALSLWPVRDLERIIYPDGTGLSPQHFHAYFDERYRRKKPKKPKPSLLAVPANAVLSPRDVRLRARELEREAKRLESAKQKPRLHTWAYAEFLWAYESTMIAALHFQDSPFGEAPKFLALLEQARVMLEVKEIGGDKAYDANYIFQYADAQGIAAHISIRDTGIPTKTDHTTTYRKAAMIESLMDPEGHEAKANRRNLAECGNAAFKARLGDEVYCRGRRRDGKRDATSLEVEVHCMALAWNITRLVLMEERHGAKDGQEPVVKLDFTGGAERLRATPWRDLPDLERELRKRYPPKGDGGVREAWKP